MTVPGKRTELLPIVPGLIALPADFITKLMSLDEPAVSVKAPETIVDALVPLVVSYVNVAVLPVVLAAKVMAPFWLMILFEVKVMSEPLAPVMAPDW